MNQVFSFKRFWWLAKRQWGENAGVYKWWIGGIILVTLVVNWLAWMSGNLSPDEYPRFQVEKGIINLDVPLILLYIYGAWFFNGLRSKSKRAHYFSLPVSPLERVMVAFTFVVILFPVLLTTFFTVCDFVYIQIFNHIHGVSMPMFIKPTNPFGIPATSWVTVLWYISIISMFTLGSLLFGKNGLVMIFTVVLLLTIPAFIITVETKTSVKIETRFSPTYEGFRIESNQAKYSIMGRTTGGSGFQTEYMKSQGHPDFPYHSEIINRAIQKYETEGISETEEVETSKVLATILSVFYSIITPLCWLMMFFAMKRKEA